MAIEADITDRSDGPLAFEEFMKKFPRYRLHRPRHYSIEISPKVAPGVKRNYTVDFDLIERLPHN